MQNSSVGPKKLCLLPKSALRDGRGALKKTEANPCWRTFTRTPQRAEFSRNYRHSLTF
jgi:hypothetical protein